MIVVDTQRSVIAGAYEAERTVRNIGIAVDKARDSGVTVAWVQHEDETLVRGSDAWTLAEGLCPEAGDLLIAKRYNSSFEETPLDSYLKERGIRTVALAGAATNWCIRATAYGALERGYDLTILSDAHTTRDLDIPGGPIIPASVLIAEFNAGLANVEYPGRTCSAITAGSLRFE